MRKPMYDVFISYRREGGSDLAEVVRKHLATRGYKVFLDVRDTPAGPFDEALKRIIATTPDFVVLLTAGCFDRCGSADDWFRTEIAHALATSRNIVPVRIEEFAFPPKESLPGDIAQLPMHHNIRYTHDHCDAAIDDICRRLISRLRVRRRRAAILAAWAAGISVVAVTMLSLVLWGVFRPPQVDQGPVAAESPDSTKPSEHWVMPPIKPLPPQVASLPAADVLQIAYGGTPPTASLQAERPKLQMEILSRREGESTFSCLNDNDTLASKTDDYFIVVRPLSQGYLYVFQVDSAGKKTWLFPENETSPYSSGSNPVIPREILQVPSAESKRVLFLDNNVGIEHIYAVFSATRWPDLEEALAHPSPDSPPAAEPDSDLLATTVRSPNNLLWRGVGGVRVEEHIDQIAPTFTLKRIDQDQIHSVSISAQPLQASGSFLVVERWFRHVNPD